MNSDNACSASPTITDWLNHRLGLKRYVGPIGGYEVKALELNKRGKNLIDTFGNREFRGYVGFIDLVGFSRAIRGKSPMEASNYIAPFLNSISTAAKDEDVFIDKFIGDEGMFLIPDRNCDFGHRPPTFYVSRFISSLYNQFLKMDKKYPCRFGISYGSMYLSSFGGDSYSEWTVIGETINLSKRLHKLRKLQDNIDRWGFGGAFAILMEQDVSPSSFEALLHYATGAADKLSSETLIDTQRLKGISEYRAAIIYPGD